MVFGFDATKFRLVFVLFACLYFLVFLIPSPIFEPGEFGGLGHESTSDGAGEIRSSSLRGDDDVSL